MFLQDDPLQACVLNLQILQTSLRVLRMDGESMGSYPPNVFLTVDRTNVAVASGVNIVLKLKLFTLMLLFKEFSNFVCSKSARIELVALTTYAQKVC